MLDKCRDKDGKLEEKKAILKLIDAFTLSQYTAKRLLDYHLESKSDCVSEIAALTSRVETAKKAAQDAGCALDEEYRYTKDGEVVTQASVRSLSTSLTRAIFTVRSTARCPPAWSRPSRSASAASC